MIAGRARVVVPIHAYTHLRTAAWVSHAWWIRHAHEAECTRLPRGRPSHVRPFFSRRQQWRVQEEEGLLRVCLHICRVQGRSHGQEMRVGHRVPSHVLRGDEVRVVPLTPFSSCFTTGNSDSHEFTGDSAPSTRHLATSSLRIGLSMRGS